MKNIRWPSFFIVGVGRGATTTLHDYLSRTSSVSLPKMKETAFFTTIVPSQLPHKPIRDPQEYLNSFSNFKNASFLGESCPSYMMDPKSPELIHERIPNAKIIMILRNPISKSYSHYLARLGQGKTYTFSETINESLADPQNYYTNIFTLGCKYSFFVEKYIKLFGKENVKIYIFEEFIKNHRKYVKEIFSFIGIKEEVPPEKKLTHNVIVVPRNKTALRLLQNKNLRNWAKTNVPVWTSAYIVKKVLGKKTEKTSIPEKEKIFLKSYFKEDVQNLEKLLGQKLPWDI